MYTSIIGTGSALPSKVVPNSYFETILDTTDEWIVSRTGIKERHFVEEGGHLIDLIEESAHKAIADAGITAQDIGLIIVSTDTPEKLIPSTASILQGRLGVKRVAAFDMQAACAGYVYGMGIADGMMKASNIEYALVIGAAKYSTLLDMTDRATCVLFGDGAGATVLKLTDEPGLVGYKLSCEGSFCESLQVPWGPAQGIDAITEENRYVTMDGQAVYKQSVRLICDEVEQFMQSQNITSDEIDWFIPHQANERIIDAMAKRININKERCIITLDKHANTSSASIPLAMDVARRDGRIKSGDTVLLEGFGAGFSWGSMLVKMV